MLKPCKCTVTANCLYVGLDRNRNCADNEFLSVKLCAVTDATFKRNIVTSACRYCLAHTQTHTGTLTWHSSTLPTAVIQSNGKIIFP